MKSFGNICSTMERVFIRMELIKVGLSENGLQSALYFIVRHHTGDLFQTFKGLHARYKLLNNT